MAELARLSEYLRAVALSLTARVRPATLFVYGTLKRRAPRRQHPLMREARYLARASVSGVLYDLGKYPGLMRTPRNGKRVTGELYELPDECADAMIRALDVYEGSEYVRQRIYVTLANGKRRAAWTYLLRRRPKSAVILQSGRFRLRPDVEYGVTRPQ